MAEICSAQDPRLEAAKPKGRGTADASEKALEASGVAAICHGHDSEKIHPIRL